MRTTSKDQFGIPTTTFRPNPVCMKMLDEEECGYCTWSIKEKYQYVGENKETWLYGKPWSQIAAEAVLMPSESYARLKADIVENCKKSQECNKDIAKWRVKLDSLDSLNIFSLDSPVAPPLKTFMQNGKI